MGLYYYKVLKKSVLLENGERAHLALYAYRYNFWDSKNWHLTSGAARCDEGAANGERGPWIVHGYKERDGTIRVNPIAYKAEHPMGSYLESFKHIDQAVVARDKLGKGLRFGIA